MKIIRQKPSKRLMSVGENFATLRDIDAAGSFLYEISVNVDATEALKSFASIINLVVALQPPAPEPDVFEGIRSGENVGGWLSTMLTFNARLSDANENAKLETTTNANIDITTGVDNGLKLDASDTKHTKKGVQFVKAEVLEASNASVPKLSTGSPLPSKDVEQRQQADALSMIEKGVDPSTIAEPHSPSAGAESVLAGTGKPSATADTDASGNVVASSDHDRLRASLLGGQDAPQRSTLVAVVTNVSVENVNSIKQVVVPASVGLGDFYVTFELTDALGVVIERESRRVAHRELVKLLRSPRLAPGASIAQSQPAGKNTVEIEQRDPFADRIRIMRRESGKDSSGYITLGDVPVAAGMGAIKFVDRVNNAKRYMYRCIPVGSDGIMGFEFTNAVSPAVQPRSARIEKQHDTAFVAAQSSVGGISLTVTVSSVNAVAVSIMRIDMTVKSAEILIGAAKDGVIRIGRGQSSISFLDADVKQGHTYSYRCCIHTRTGMTILSAPMLEEYVPRATGVATITVSAVTVGGGASQLDVTFDVSSKLSDEGLSIVKTLIDNQGLTDLFTDDLITERGRLGGLIAHSIVRTNTTTGLEDDLGVLIGTKFSDRTLSTAVGAAPVSVGNAYRYTISTLVRDPETMLVDFVKTAKDSSTGRTYSFKPSKFHHPLTLSLGTLVSAESIKANHPFNEFIFGMLGNSIDVDVSLGSISAAITRVSVRRVDRFSTVIRWTLDGPADAIDHFIVMKTRNDGKSIVGKSHNVSDGGSFMFIDALSPDDIGMISYGIVPVMADFSRGSAVTSNDVIIEGGT